VFNGVALSPQWLWINGVALSPQWLWINGVALSPQWLWINGVFEALDGCGWMSLRKNGRPLWILTAPSCTGTTTRLVIAAPQTSESCYRFQPYTNANGCCSTSLQCIFTYFTIALLSTTIDGMLLLH
jgi:hypothetical protein